MEQDKSEAKPPTVLAANDKGTEKEAKQDNATMTKGTAKQRVEKEARKDDALAKGSVEDHTDSQEVGKKVEDAENEGGKEDKTSGQKSAVVKAKESTPNSAETPKFNSTGGRFKRVAARKSTPKPPAAKSPNTRSNSPKHQTRSGLTHMETNKLAAKSASQSRSSKRKAPQERLMKSEPARKKASAEFGNGPRNPIWTGEPDDNMSREGGWPKGWKKEIHVRKSGTSKGHKDRYWFSPKMNLKFRSLITVKCFLGKLKECDGDEQKAYKIAGIK